MIDVKIQNGAVVFTCSKDFYTYISVCILFPKLHLSKSYMGIEFNSCLLYQYDDCCFAFKCAICGFGITIGGQNGY